MAYNDARGAALAIAFIEGKLKNQANVLKYFAKYRRVADPELYAELEARLQEILTKQPYIGGRFVGKLGPADSGGTEAGWLLSGLKPQPQHRCLCFLGAYGHRHKI
nr:CRISPR-associated endonuclease Cas1 [Ammonifex thiophilus]